MGYVSFYNCCMLKPAAIVSKGSFVVEHRLVEIVFFREIAM